MKNLQQKIINWLKPTTPEELAELAKRLTPPDDIRDLVPVSGKPEDWLFYGGWKKINQSFKLLIKQSCRFADKNYWTKVNTIEATSFATKICIIFPGLLFGRQWWWLYVFALMSSIALIATSTLKTLPTIIWFNICWSILAIIALIKHFI